MQFQNKTNYTVIKIKNQYADETEIASLETV